MRVECAVISDVGKRRNNNEDNYFLNGSYREDVTKNHSREAVRANGKNFLFAVCDGMGGEDSGEIASLSAVRAMNIWKENDWKEDSLEKFVTRVQENMTSAVSENGKSHMGSTAVILQMDHNSATVVNLGDSRAYLFRDGVLHQLSKDHTQAQLLAEHGLLSKEMVRKHKGGHILTRYLGLNTELSVEDFYVAQPITVQKEDIFLLCSDGLTDMLTEREIEECMEKYKKKEAGKLAQALCEAALLAGGNDNVTCLLVKNVRKIGGYPQKRGWL